MKTIDLSDLKAGDKAWSVRFGNVILCNPVNTDYPIQLIDDTSFDVHGCNYEDDPHPMIFHSEQEFREYWGLQRDIDAPLTKREQFAMAAMHGLMANPEIIKLKPQTVSRLSLEQADDLINGLFLTN
jgi:hypothetical protein